MTVHHSDEQVTVHHGNALDILPTLADASVDSICTDPPYEMAFMGRSWDASGIAYNVELWKQALCVLKPGGHLLAFGGTRTVHRMTCAIEDAGFEIRDGIDWLYAQGFPKSLNVSEAIDRQRAARGGAPVDEIRAWLNARRLEAGLSLSEVNEALGAASNGGGLASSWMTNPTSKGLPDWRQWGQLKALLGFGNEKDAEVQHLHVIAAGEDRPVVGLRTTGRGTGRGAVPVVTEGRETVSGPATELARDWQGWGTALKPAREPIVVARKPLDGTVAANVLAHGPGAINIDACRTGSGAAASTAGAGPAGVVFGAGLNGARAPEVPGLGRWPTNVILSHAGGPECADLCANGCAPGCPVAELDAQSGVLSSGAMAAGTVRANTSGWSGLMPSRTNRATPGDSGGASRFFPVFRYEAKAPTSERPKVDGEAHPTVKPLDLMQWLVRLVTPPGGTVLDPFLGSGTTAEACLVEGFRCIGIELEAAHLPLIMARLSKPIQTSLFGAFDFGEAS